MKTVAQTCMVTCIDNGKSMEAHVLSFRPGEFLSVAIETIKINLRYAGTGYVGSMGNLTLTSIGPQVITYRRGR
jgi:hypothetical protein